MSPNVLYQAIGSVSGGEELHHIEGDHFPNPRWGFDKKRSLLASLAKKDESLLQLWHLFSKIAIFGNRKRRKLPTYFRLKEM